MIGHTMISKSFCAFLLYQTNASIHVCAMASPTRQGIVTILGLGSTGRCKFLLTAVFFAALVTNTLIRDYMINYARSFVYTTSICFDNIIAADSPFYLLEQGALELVGPFQNTSIITLTSAIPKGP